MQVELLRTYASLRIVGCVSHLGGGRPRASMTSLKKASLRLETAASAQMPAVRTSNEASHTEWQMPYDAEPSVLTQL